MHVFASSPTYSHISVRIPLSATGILREITGIGPAIMKVMFKPIMAMLKIPIDEVGEHQKFFATSARLSPAVESETAGIALSAC